MEFQVVSPFARFVRHLVLTPSTIFPPFIPLDARLFYIESGKGKVHLDGTTHELEAGCLLYINAGIRYQLLPCDAVILAVNFDFTDRFSTIETPIPPANANLLPNAVPNEQLRFTDTPYFNTYYIFKNCHILHAQLHHLEEEFVQKMPFYRQETRSILLSVLTLLARRAEKRESEETRFDIRAVVTYIHTNFAQPLNNTLLAAKFHFHPNYLSAEFKRYTGKPLHQYVLETRILYAITLMESGKNNINEIAVLSGFGDRNYFSRYFKQVTGTAPGKYIRSYMK